MVEEHVGKKRRKEVRQAINMSEELRRSLIFIWTIIALACIFVVLLAYVSYSELLPIDEAVLNLIPLAVVIVVMIFIVPKANRYWALRDEYKSHLARFNINKDDMRALKDDEL